MSLSAKLEGDNLQQTCQREVEELHRLFVAWFQGESTAEALTSDLKDRLDPQFSHVAPNGQFLQGRDVLIGHLQDKFGCYKDRLFQIDIYAVQLLWHANGQALCTYEEWQSWQPEDETEEIHQFGRLSTCLLHRKTNSRGEKRYQWIHVHETWLEAEEPQHPKEEMVSTAKSPNKFDDETVMTGPVEYNPKPPPPPPPEQAPTKPPEAAPEQAPPLARSGSSAVGGEKHVLMLVSEQSLSRDQLDRQDKARVLLENVGVAFYEINGADPEQRDKRNELFKLSGKWGKYPQFFLVDLDGNTSFWGDWEDLEQSHERGTLEKDLHQHKAEEEEEEDGDDDDDDDDDDDSDDSDDEEEEDEQEPEKEAAPVPEAASKPTNGQVNGARPVSRPPGLLLLISSQVLSADHKERQQDVVTTLKTKKIAYLEVDGSMPEKREQRNELFKLSKVWGLYPQIFLIDQNTRDITYWGGWDKFHEAQNAGNLEAELGVASRAAPPTPTLETPVAEAAPPKEAQESSSKQAIAVNSDDVLRKKFMSTECVIVLLISNHSLSNEQMARQDNCRSMLNEKQLKFEEIDGAARESRDARNELFKVSKLWGRYPQLFVSKPSGENVFWGEWDSINESNNKGTLVQDLVRLVGEEVPETMLGDKNDEDESSSSSSEEDETEENGDGVIHISDEENDEGKEEPVAHSRAIAAPVENGDAHADEEEEDEAEALKPSTDQVFMERASGILEFEDEEEEGDNEKELEAQAEAKLKEAQEAASPIPQDASSKRHVSPKILKYAKPLAWENTLVGISISGFDIGTSQGPMADESWYKEVGDGLESIAQCRTVSRPRRQISLPEMVFPTAHVALEGHGMWMSWDALDALEEWARAHQEIAVNSGAENRGVSVLKAKDAKLWESKRQHMNNANSNVPSVFHYDWTFSSPFCGKVEGGSWVELDESGMRTQLLTDKTSPILFFDEIILFEDDLHDNGQVEFSVKLRVMPSCAYVLARLFVRVDNVVVRVRETRLLIDFFGITPQIFRDVTWRECFWENLEANGLPTDVRSWTISAGDVAAFHGLVQKLPEIDLPDGLFKHAMLEPDITGGSVSQLQMSVRASGTNQIFEL